MKAILSPRAHAFILALALAATSFSASAQNRARDADDDPEEYRDRREARDAYRRGYERGYERGYRKGLAESDRRPVPVAPPAPPPAPPAPILGPIRVTSAFYGSGSKNCDATRFAARQSNRKRSHSFKVTNEMCGDPHHGARKTLEVTFWCGQVARTASAREHQTIFLNCN
jgi:hypothetical protein